MLYKDLPEKDINIPFSLMDPVVIQESNWRRNAAKWSLPQEVTETAESKGELSQFAEEKAIHLALDSTIAE